MSRSASRAAGSAALILLFAGCSQSGLVSSWTRQGVAVDGDQAEWQGLLQKPEGRSIALGVMNDSDYLYVTLSSLDRRTLMQIMSRGLTVWFDPQGRNRKVLGIRYPVGAITMGLQEEGWGRWNRRGQAGLEELLEQMVATELWIEVTGPERDDLARITRGGESGLQVEVASKLGQFVYELRIPLNSSAENPHALNAAPGETISIGYEGGGTSATGLRRPTGGFGSGGRGGGRGGFGAPGGGRGGFSGGRGGAGRGQLDQPLKHWVRVTLASPAAQERTGS